VVLVFDEAQNAFGAVPARASPPNLARTQHVAVPTPGGVIIAGGVNGMPLAPVLELEFFDRLTNRVAVGTTLLPAQAVGGGWVPSRSGAALVAGASLVLVDPALNVAPQRFTLSTARSAAHVFASGSDVIVAGGSTTEIVELDAPRVTPGPAVPAAAGSCAAELGGDRWLFVSGADVTLLSRSGGYTATLLQPFGAPRTEATCTALDDGTVLVAGGRDGSGAALGDAWVFTPPLQ
jgi:hypothetical protein